MSRSLPIAWREHVISFVDEGQSHREAAGISVLRKKLAALKHKTASLLLRPQEHIGDSKLSAHHDWVGKRLAQNSALMPDELHVERRKRVRGGLSSIAPSLARHKKNGFLLTRHRPIPDARDALDSRGENSAIKRIYPLVRGSLNSSLPDCDCMKWFHSGSLRER